MSSQAVVDTVAPVDAALSKHLHVDDVAVSHESTSSGECLPLTRSTDGSSTENLPEPTTKVYIPEISLAPVKPEIAHTIVCREWKTESIAMPEESPPALSTTIPEKDAVLWLIKDFSAFRSAAKRESR